MKRSIFFVVSLAVVLIAVFLINKGEESVPKQEAAILTPSEGKIIVIKITEEGFEPEEMIIDAGDTVKFINQSSKSRWPASDIHPTHQLYPGSGLIKCGTAEAGSIFDACRGLARGESFSFTLNEKGTWFFHDHLQPLLSGKIIVQ